MDYFPHDTHAMSDDRLLALRIKNGLEAVAAYWVILEKIYADEEPFDTSETNIEATSVLLRLGVGFEELQKHVSAMVEVGLLERDENAPSIVMSARAQSQIDELCRKREIARQNGKSGGRKPMSAKRRNQRKTNVGSSLEPKSDTYKTLNGIGSDKQNLIPSASADAGGDEPAPRAGAPTCGNVECTAFGSPLSPTGMFMPNTDRRVWKCSKCGSEAAIPDREASHA